jgi:carbamoyl-phosphate synthase large subunit
VKAYPGLNFPLAEKTMGLQASHMWAARLILGESLENLNIQEPSKRGRYCVRESTFPFPRFPGMDPVLSPRMLSDGQVLGTDSTYTKAYLKSQIAANPTMPFRGNVFISARDSDKQAIFQISRKLTDLGFSLVSTQGTAQFLADRGIKVDWIHKVSGHRPNVIDLIKNGDISLVINIPGGVRSKRDEMKIRRVTIENNIPLVTSASGAFLMVKGIEDCQRDPLALEPYEV